jgi:polar amino acid transport system substrate-binding protein
MNRMMVGLLSLAVVTILVSWVHGTELRFNTQDFAPFNYAIEGVVSGPAVDIIRAVCTDMQVTCSFRLLPWTRAQEEVRKGMAHGMFVIGWNEERAKWLYFSPPILDTEYGFFVHNDNPLQFKDVSDVKGYRVGVFGPSNTATSLEEIKAQIGDLTIEMRANDEAGFKKLALSRVDAVYSNRDVGNHLIAKLGLNNIRYAGMHRTLQYYIGFSQEHTEKTLLEQFNRSFRELHKRGVIHQILGRYTMQAAALD